MRSIPVMMLVYGIGLFLPLDPANMPVGCNMSDVISILKFIICICVLDWLIYVVTPRCYNKFKKTILKIKSNKLRSGKIE